MKKYIFSWLILCAGLGLSAQTHLPASTQRQQSSRWSIALTAGPAIPVGTFAGIHNDHATQNKVDAGGSAELDGAYRICRSFSAILAINGQFDHGNGIPYDVGKLLQAGQSSRQGALGNDWQIARILAGGSYTLPFSRRSGPALLLKALAGVQRTRTPDFSYPDMGIFPIPDYTNTTLIPGQPLPWAFSYQLDAGIKWKLTGRWSALAYAGYNGCKPAKKAYQSVTPGGVIISPAIPLPTGTIALRAGLELAL